MEEFWQQNSILFLASSLNGDKYSLHYYTAFPFHQSCTFEWYQTERLHGFSCFTGATQHFQLSKKHISPPREVVMKVSLTWWRNSPHRWRGHFSFLYIRLATKNEHQTAEMTNGMDSASWRYFSNAFCTGLTSFPSKPVGALFFRSVWRG